MNPPIGVPRLYQDVVEVLYPGEMAHAVINTPAAQALVLQYQDRGINVQIGDELPREDDVDITLPLQWVVEPEPGWRAALLRLQYRACGQWIDRAYTWWLKKKEQQQ